MRVNVISESSFTVKGHGVHSVYEDNLEALRNIRDLEVVDKVFAKTDIIHLHTAGPIAALLMRYSAPVSVVTAHLTPDSLTGSLSGGRLLAPVVQHYLCWFYNGADSVIALSSHARDQLRQMGVRTPITVIPNVVPDWQPDDAISRGVARRLLGISENKRVILSVGQVQPRKAISTFYDCAQSMPETLFIWVGGFPFGILTARYWTMRRMIKLSPANVMHTGHLKRKDVRAYYSAADVYFHPSHHELGPVAVLEAAAHGLPLVLRDLDCYEDAPSESYIPGTDQTFTAQLRSLFDNGFLRDRMAEGASRLAASVPSNRAGTALGSLYRRLLSGPRSSKSKPDPQRGR